MNAGEIKGAFLWELPPFLVFHPRVTIDRNGRLLSNDSQSSIINMERIDPDPGTYTLINTKLTRYALDTKDGKGTLINNPS